MAVKVYRDPLESGFMRSGFFAWPATRFKCPGYVRYDRKTGAGHQVDCGVEFESYTGTVQRCQSCRKAHRKEWFWKDGKARRAR